MSKPKAPRLVPLLNREQTILIIDDEEPFTEMLRLNLELTTDYRIVVENNSENALSMIRRCKPDLILLDAIMPGLDGFDVLRRIENDRATHHIPVIFLSAISHKIDFPLFHLSEVVQRKTMGKPVRIKDLVELIESELPDQSIQ